jgi:hypothetical protein
MVLAFKGSLALRTNASQTLGPPLREIDLRTMLGRSGRATVAGQQWGIECLRQDNVNCVMSRKVLPQLPDSRQQDIMCIAVQWKSDKSSYVKQPLLDSRRCRSAQQR